MAKKAAKKPATGKGAMATAPTPKPDPEPINVDRINTRIRYLKKNRPNDPEIKQLQAKLKQAAPAAASTPATTSAPTTPAPTPVTPISQEELGYKAGTPWYEQPTATVAQPETPTLPATYGQPTPAPAPQAAMPNMPTQPEVATNEMPPTNMVEQFRGLTPGQQDVATSTTGGGIFEQMGQYAQRFNPMTFQQEYNPVFSQEMERARQNVMSTFERRNAEQFARQNEEIQRQIAERGLDPASPAAQALMKRESERQDLARQEAMSAAENAAQGIQQQMFGQATNVAMMPGQIGAQFLDPYMMQAQARIARQAGETDFQYQQRMAQMGYAYGGAEAERGRQFEGGQAQQQRDWQAEQANLQRRFESRMQQRQLAAQRRMGGGGGGGGGVDPWQQYLLNQTMQNYQPQQPQPDAISQGAQGFLQGVGVGFGQQLGRGS